MNPTPDFHIDPVNWQREAVALKQLVAVDAEAIREFDQKVTTTCCDIAIHAWRAQRRMVDRSNGEVKEEHRAIHRSVAGILETLREFGFNVRDREGEPYDYGLPEKVVAAEKRVGLGREMVAETLRPSIFFGSQLARAGEIVIAVPEDAPPPAPNPPPSESADSPPSASPTAAAADGSSSVA